MNDIGEWVLEVDLVSGWLMDSVRAITYAGLAVIIASLLWQRRWRKLIWLAAISLVCGAVGLLLAWLVSDVWVTFGVKLGWVVIRRTGLGIGMIALAIGLIWGVNGWWRRTFAILLAINVAFFGVLQVNAAYNQYPRLRSVLGLPYFPQLDPVLKRTASVSIEQWRETQAATAPSSGRAFAVDIPATTSGFSARHADVWLPPAALTEQPAQLPVIIFFSGQPGGPDDAFVASHLDAIADAYAQAHGGVAPIIVSPDQLGDPLQNTLCVDSPVYGAAETYLTVDVPAWVRANLPVQTSVNQWAIAGFSQGATCSLQLGIRHPDLFAHMAPISSELQPTDGSEQSMIDRFFGGSREAFVAHTPLGAIAEHTPSSQSILFSAGSTDGDSVDHIRTIGSAAQKAGMHVEALISAGTGHDWWTVTNVLPAVIDRLGVSLGLAAAPEPISTWPKLSEMTVS